MELAQLLARIIHQVLESKRTILAPTSLHICHCSMISTFFCDGSAATLPAAPTHLNKGNPRLRIHSSSVALTNVATLQQRHLREFKRVNQGEQAWRAMAA